MELTEPSSAIRSRRPSWRPNSPWAAGFLLLLAYVAVAIGTVRFVQRWVDPSLDIASVAAPWLAVGVGVAGVLLGGARLWPALFIGSWCVWGGFVGDPPISVTVDAVAEAGSIVLIVHLLRIWGFHRSFDRFRDPLVLLAAATVGRILAVLLDWVGGFAAAWLMPESFPAMYRPLLTDATGAFPVLTPEVFSASARWSLNSIAGIMLVVPLASATLDGLRKTYHRRSISLLALCFSLLAWSLAALNLPAAWEAPLLVTALMLVAWASVRFEPPAAAFATLAMSLVATAGVAMRLGPLTASSPVDSIGLQWGFIAMLVLTGLSLTALLAERRRDLRQLNADAERYQRLFRSNPSPLWVAEPDGGRILMVNDEAIRCYGFSETEFLAMTVAQLAADPDLYSAAAPVAGGLRSLRHRTRAGGLIDVEMLSTPIDLDGRPAELCYAVDVTDRVELRSRIFAAVDLERGRLAQELHDGLGQVLSGLSFGAQAAAVRVSRGAAVDAAFIEFLIGTSNHVVKLCRQLTRGVSPLQDAGGDLLEALRRLPNSLPPGSVPSLEVEIEVEAEAPLRLSLARSEHLYRVVQEAVTNALKHARAAHIRARVAVTPELVQVSVEDDGIGIQAGAGPANGIGMRSMALRAAAVGASVEVLGRPGGGTVIRCECPQQERVPARRPVQAAANDPVREPAPASATGTVQSFRRGPALHVYLGRCLLLAAGCCMGIALSVALARIIDPRVGVSGSRMAVPSLLVGVSTAGLLLGGARLWPGIAFGALVGAIVLMHEPGLLAIYFAADVTLVALFIRELLARWRFGRAFDRWQDPLLLFGAAIAGGGLIGMLNFLGLMTYQWLRPGEMSPALIALMTNAAGATPVVTGAFLASTARASADAAAGVVLFVPLLVATPPIARTLAGHHGEAALWCMGLLGWVAGMFLLSEVGVRLPLVAMALVLLVWAAVRFGAAMASLAMSVCAMAATTSFVMQRGALSSINVNEGIATLWGFLGLLTVTGMLLTALLAERNRTLRTLAATTLRYRRLFAHGPHPLWVQDRITGRILMVNEQAIRHYGYSEGEWLAMTVDDLAARTVGGVYAGGARDHGTIETRHRLKSRAVIDVELSFAPIDMDGRPTLLCFAIDVTERNTLRREFLEATDLERRRLADELRYGLGRTLMELESAAARLQLAASTDRVDPAAMELIARTSQRAVEVCRQIAHSATTGGNRFDQVEGLTAR
jgi:two-component system sensor kinase FixL